MRNIVPSLPRSRRSVGEFIQKVAGMLLALLYLLPLGHPAMLAAQNPEPVSLSPSVSRITETDSVTLPGNVRPETWSSIDLGAAPGSLALQHMVLLLKRSGERQAALQNLLAAQQDRKSLQYHHWLTPAKYADEFGVSSETVAAISGWLQSYGMRVDSVTHSHMFIVFSGTNAQLQQAFHTEIHKYDVNGALHYANSSNPEIPSSFAPTIAGITSLHDFHSRSLHSPIGVAHSDRSAKGWRLDSTPEFTTAINGNTYYAVTPYDFATIYNVAPLWNEGITGSGQSIAIVSRSDISPTDVDNFRASFGLPATNLNIIYDGPNPGKTADESEADLDVEWSGAVATSATINLVVAGSTDTTDGSFLSAQYIVDNNVAPIMSMSYGECEPFLGAAGNQSYAELWQQAAAQGISVVVASGDSGSASCDQSLEAQEPAATWGLTVSGVASTANNVAVGGTDFFANFANASTYWSATNAANLSSALSYVPEVPWNNTCGSADVLFAVRANGGTDTTNEALCNDANYPQLLGLAGGSGGASNCIAGISQTLADCGGGYPKPVWQSNVPGIPADQVRDLPDVSLFAGNGIWNSFYLFCSVDSSADGSCDYNNANDVTFLAAGGTSFASPSFAGIMALVEQQVGGPQGNPNYMLYELASQQYGRLGTACQSSTVAAGNTCIFYDITSSSNKVPCEAGTADCNPTNPNDTFALLPGWKAAPGFDLATGLGSVNAYNIVHSWGNFSSGELASQTSLTLPSATASYGTPLAGTVQVSAAADSGTPTGDIALEASTTPGAAMTGFGSYALAAGKTAFSINLLPAGDYPLIARYGGDSSYASSTSQTAVTITPGGTVTSLNASRVSLSPGEGVALSAVVQTTSFANSPTGNITFTDSTTGATLGKVPASANTNASTGASIATAQLTVGSGQLASGSNSVIAVYAGDGNYNGSASAGVAVTLEPMFSVGVNPTSVTLNGTASGSASITLTPNAALSLPVTLSCGNLPVGMSCSFSPSVVPAGAGATSSTVTIQYAAPVALLRRRVAALTSPAFPWKRAPGAVGFALLGLLMVPRRRRSQWLGCMLLTTAAFVVTSCGGSSTSRPRSTVQATTTTLASATSSVQLGAAVMFSVNVSSDAGTPSGVVVLQDGSSVLGSQSLSNGSATFSISSLPLGSNALVATYDGDSTHASSSATVTENVELTSNLNVIGADAAGDTASTPLSVTVQ
jgi:Pro-kumamolisin, activation domain/Bacterial Ig-like domain (group 3)